MLKKNHLFSLPKGPVLLIIMDGIGLGKKEEGNAVFLAHTPTLDALQKSPLYRTLKAHGKAVGMPSDEDMGNSEVGHNALGAGRVFDQGASLVNQAIQTKKIYQGKTWNWVMQAEGTLHFIGLLSDGNVHSHIRHLKDMTQTAVAQGKHKIRFHVLLDGRDVGATTALHYVDELETLLKTLNDKGADCQIASGGGRMVTTMDRYNADWSTVKRGWDAHVLGKATCFQSAKEAIHAFYAEQITDQYLPPFVITEKGTPVGLIEDGDAVIFFNFRGDRAIELTQAFEQDTFSHFDRVKRPKVRYAGMMQYDGDLKLPQHFLVDPPDIEAPLGVYLCQTGLKSFAISETQKFGHVTYFWNGNKSGYINPQLETYVEIPSDQIPFDQAPEMKAKEITKDTIALLQSGQFQFGRVNFPNGDMVGHTGNLKATIAAVEATDLGVAKLIDCVNALNGITVVLADHGNADEMVSVKNGIKEPKTSHTLNPVPFAIVDHHATYTLRQDLPDAGLANVAATLCALLGYEAPVEYAPSLIQPKS